MTEFITFLKELLRKIRRKGRENIFMMEDMSCF